KSWRVVGRVGASAAARIATTLACALDWAGLGDSTGRTATLVCRRTTLLLSRAGWVAIGWGIDLRAAVPRSRQSHRSSAAASRTHNAVFCAFVKLANRASNTLNPASAGGAACNAALKTASATPVEAETMVCSKAAAAAATVVVLKPRRLKN